MTLLLSHTDARRRRAAVRGDMPALAASLRSDLDAAAPTLGTGWLPPEKARMTRHGGRCRRDGTLLLFDPASRREHRCPLCGDRSRDEADYRWWIMNYQLWLAERAVHGATLALATDNPSAATVARQVLERYADRYLTYPNADNVLGPTRLFFSTYLESIWLLQLATALDLLEAGGLDAAFGARVRDRVIEPSARLIAEFNEGESNRQVWNNAALAAAGRLLGDSGMVEAALSGSTGLAYHLQTSLLGDGTWYEGENYHLFAHRGLWYGVQIAETAGVSLPPHLVARFQVGFRTPFVTSLPDFTFPSRRDSQYRVSLRQWRTAEWCELGLARSPDDSHLRAALHEMYRVDVPGTETGRAVSTAEAERNVPGARLTRASLGWKALLFATPELPPLDSATPSSALLGDQGYAVLRREDGRVYVALDYGHSGSGHGHPDRLNLWFVDGDDRLLEDPGTGSYTSPALHWYRSSLAHNAPFVNGASQQPVDGQLLSYGDADGVSWVAAAAEIAPGAVATRTVIVLANALIDIVSWTAAEDVQVDLPVHCAAPTAGLGEWRALPLAGGALPTDGFPFLSRTAKASVAEPTVCLTRAGVRGWFETRGVEWWRATAPGPPASPPREFYLQRQRGQTGRFRSVWSWSALIRQVSFDADAVTIHDADGQTVLESLDGAVLLTPSSSRVGPPRRIDIPERLPRHAPPDAAPPEAVPIEIPVNDDSPRAAGEAQARAGVSFQLGRNAYRRSELTWDEVGRPTARVTLTADCDAVVFDVTVDTSGASFAGPTAENPLDNEHPDTNSDGVQLYVGEADGIGSWLLVPAPPSPGVRITKRSTRGPSELRASAVTTTLGWQMRIELPRHSLSERGHTPFTVDLVVNLMAPGRERRHGQLVLGGARGEWTYLRGDRQDPSRALPFVIADD